ncbi:MAG TPA: chromate resistance protein ChrB domain-containing protein, partial [Vicinamibacterales bacterium]|nr:chromate resistance protein ChrB domain-containing protein [Vicinamibacterales bacterium]
AERALPARSGDPHSDAGRPRGTYRARLRVTRPRPGVDRMASAWLIRRFIDCDAAFSFVRDREKAPQDAVPFDMFGVEFGHRDTNCTFETLCDVVAIADPAVVRVAAVVHDLNPKTAQFRAAETATIGALIEGLRLAHADDQELLEVGMTLVESLYQTFEQASKRPRPRQVARAASNPQAPLALTRADALFRTKIHSHGESDGARISWQANNQPGVARLRRQEFVVLLVQQIARPEEHRPALVPAEARTQVDQAVAVDHHVARG